MNFTLSPEIEDVRVRTARFVAAHILPLEADPANYDAHENIRLDLLEEVRAKAKAEGLWCPQIPKAMGGMGLPMVGQAVMYEEANRSIFGPCVFHAAAPEDGNMRVLSQVATPDQQARWLQPLIEGKVRSALAMTEPAPGGGSDPTMIRTRATPKGNTAWSISGTKWFITGAEEAEHFIVIARTSDEPRRNLTAFLFHRDTPGFRIKRRIGIMGPEEHGGHCELAFDDMEIPDEDRLMEVGEGMKMAQIRLGPARLTHCMRWLGLAKRCMEIAQAYIETRESFGIKLKDRESVQLMMGDVAKDIQVGRLLTMHAAWMLDQGERANQEVSMAKLHVAGLLHKAADTAIQLNGARGYSKDTVLEWIYRYARQARLVDGADEVHKMVLARNYSANGSDVWRWGV
ncbi:MAG: acyl-CoA dehydrogenase family protein [Pseudomonadota bacterium]